MIRILSFFETIGDVGLGLYICFAAVKGIYKGINRVRYAIKIRKRLRKDEA